MSLNCGVCSNIGAHGGLVSRLRVERSGVQIPLQGRHLVRDLCSTYAPSQFSYDTLTTSTLSVGK